MLAEAKWGPHFVPVSILVPSGVGVNGGCNVVVSLLFRFWSVFCSFRFGAEFSDDEFNSDDTRFGWKLGIGIRF